ncbi:UNVERIFIED_CONTAM: hypothetical protein Slati_2488500 [Sesamum latifolium]|uniref:Retrotransposon gag domain-containing protein n=1 Tax=Sesamum latifolium TaxID=2727402 RepID=A0AAW2WIL7_9LAMI
MPHSSRTNELQFNPKIEKTARRLRKETKQKRIRAALDVDLTVGGELIFEEIETRMAANNREDPHKHLKDFHVVCAAMKPHGITDEQLYLRAFPFSLKDKANDWLCYLPSSSIETWADMKQ